MKRFIFTLERLLIIRKHEEEEAKLKFSSILQKKINIERENLAHEQSILNCISSIKTESEGELFDYEYLSLTENYIKSLEIKIYKNNIEKERIEIDLSKAKIELDDAIRERKKLDQLKQKKYEVYKKEVKKFETKRLDEIAGQLIERNKVEVDTL